MRIQRYRDAGVTFVDAIGGSLSGLRFLRFPLVAARMIDLIEHLNNVKH